MPPAPLQKETSVLRLLFTLTDSRIDHPVKNIHDKINKNHHECNVQNQNLHNRKVSCSDRTDQKPADPRQCKHLFYHDTSCQNFCYKDVCNPITAEFREELYTNILDAYARIKEPEKEETQKQDRTQEMPEFSVTVTPYEREGSNIKGLARIYFENSFIVNNINIVQGKEKIFVSMPSYKTKQVDEQGKPIYQDVCYPVTKDFREKLYNEIISEYEKAKDKSNEKATENAEKKHGNPDNDKKHTHFR